ncbi:50S ribosomal protein L30 [Tissierellaceae bacterium HCP3S3_D8]|jgi:large subunit ribosomal protein L30
MNTIKIKLIKSPIGKPEAHRKTIEALGLNKIGKVIEKKDTPQIRGMIEQVKHMVEVVE